MGKRSRRRRAHEKKLARWFGVTKDELGRTRHKETKAQARRRLVGRAIMRRQIEHNIVDAICKQAYDDICAQEDARVFADLSRAILGATNDERQQEAGDA